MFARSVVTKSLSVAMVLLVMLHVVGVGLAAAATLTLQSIGVSEVGGRRISSWTYIGSNPVFTGTADPNATVTITIDDTSATVTADSSGNWTYTPTTLTTAGTYQVTITSGDQTIAFTLGLSPSGSASGGTSTASTSGQTKGGIGTEELPLSGGLETTMLLVLSGLGLIGLGMILVAKVQSAA